MGSGQQIVDIGRDTATGTLRPILDAFALGPPLAIHDAGGTAARKWRVRTAAGCVLVRRRPAEFADPERIAFVHAALARLRAAGVPAPALRIARNGATWVDHDAHTFEVLEWLDADPFPVGDVAAIADVGRTLARFHAAGEPPASGEAGPVPREDHPDVLAPCLAPLDALAGSAAEHCRLGLLADQVAMVRSRLDSALYASLPHRLIHGDVHPGNLGFRGHRVAAVYDFDYLARQARVRDVADGLIFFASRRDHRLEPDDIRSLTQPFHLDRTWGNVLLAGYQSRDRLTEPEWLALPLLMRSRWLQMRIRGARKVAAREKIAFVLDTLFPQLEHLRDALPSLIDHWRNALP